MFKRLRQIVRNYFGFSKTETNGFLVLVPLMVLLLLIPTLNHRLFSGSYDLRESDLALMDSLVAAWDERVVVKAELAQPEFPLKALTAFDPNEIKPNEMMAFGFPEFLARRIDNYRNKGGKFRVKKDLKKIYGFPDSLYSRLEAYIALPVKMEWKPKTTYQKPKRKLANTTEAKNISEAKEQVVAFEAPVTKIDLNQADTTALKELRGIGKVLSSRIVKYRQKLGGFHHKEQLAEVWGISDSLFTALQDKVEVQPVSELRLMNINTAAFKELTAHPYINYKLAREILNAKSKYGKFRSPSDLLAVQGLDSVKAERLAPYVTY